MYLIMLFKNKFINISATDFLRIFLTVINYYKTFFLNENLCYTFNVISGHATKLSTII